MIEVLLTDSFPDHEVDPLARQKVGTMDTYEPLSAALTRAHARGILDIMARPPVVPGMEDWATLIWHGHQYPPLGDLLCAALDVACGWEAKWIVSFTVEMERKVIDRHIGVGIALRINSSQRIVEERPDGMMVARRESTRLRDAPVRPAVKPKTDDIPPGQRRLNLRRST